MFVLTQSQLFKKFVRSLLSCVCEEAVEVDPSLGLGFNELSSLSVWAAKKWRKAKNANKKRPSIPTGQMIVVVAFSQIGLPQLSSRPGVSGRAGRIAQLLPIRSASIYMHENM